MTESIEGSKRRFTAREWANRMEAWERSGLDAEAFAAQEGGIYTVRTLVWWKSELQRRAKSAKKCSGAKSSKSPIVSMVRVQVEPPVSRSDAAAMEVVVADRIVVRVPAEADLRRVAELVSALAETKR